MYIYIYIERERGREGERYRHHPMYYEAEFERQYPLKVRLGVCRMGRVLQFVKGGLIRLETLIELEFVNSSFPSCSSY